MARPFETGDRPVIAEVDSRSVDGEAQVGDGEPAGHRPLRAGLSSAALCALLLLGSTALSLGDVDYADSGYRRFRTDQAVAIAGHLHARYPNSLPGLGGAPWDPDIDVYYHAVLARQVRADGIRPWQLWRLARDRPLLRARGPDRVPPYDDPGRAALLEIGFRRLGGVSPFLIFWLGSLAMAPVLAWFAWESARAGRGVAGLVFALLVAASPYVVESLALARSAVGFQLVALVLLLALALPALRPRAPSAPRWLLRVACAGPVLAVCVLCRSGVLAMLPAFLAVLACGSLRAGPLGQPARRRAAVVAAALLLLLAPYALLRPAQQHDTWAGLWEGLGDYDRAKGHVWADRAAGERVWSALGRAGELPRHGGGDALVAFLARPEAVEVLRRDVLDHVRGDPAWYAGILARRALATATLARLWPRASRDGTAFTLLEAASGEPNVLNKYWGYTTTADFLGAGRWNLELPLPLLLAPLLLFGAWRAWRTRSGRERDGESPLSVVGLLAAAALAVPVLVTTASGTEPQAIVLAYYLGFGYAADELARRVRRDPPVTTA